MMQESFARKVVLAALIGALGVLAQQPDVPTFVLIAIFRRVSLDDFLSDTPASSLFRTSSIMVRGMVLFHYIDY